ncbi:MAG: hypothetical protein QOK44_951, partial [Betaproteobacteria bacterium]|nr:hypothetical protein [Betaproteobacteria bacterium]
RTNYELTLRGQTLSVLTTPSRN